MYKKLITVVFGALLIFGLVGCGSSSNTNKDSSMKGMKMDSSMKMGNQDKNSLKQAFQDELNGFTTIENDVNKKDYKSAKTLAGKLHDEFHAEILPPLKDKKGETYAENIHGKYDELQDAISDENTSKISSLIKVNRDNLHTVAKILGVSLN
ncbi:hypothetical protein PU629_04690 [Pullulanibacillus sp. KACC 23026]|uniref:hypothetical protein n=1 Tax=Pullulanibacillus sp. KACC 23026 TaxID=3028315 RepID=UPI0023B14F22|nr:hypothetical protein [Pullulanibacillus sp. KACC 23026]WEG13668.1 hypothetical protein PU629_04690 [Pullulanibacillus sp. KACC 23026]